jgi:hypothetical protein
MPPAGSVELGPSPDGFRVRHSASEGPLKKAASRALALARRKAVVVALAQERFALWACVPVRY